MIGVEGGHMIEDRMNYLDNLFKGVPVISPLPGTTLLPGQVRLKMKLIKRQVQTGSMILVNL